MNQEFPRENIASQYLTLVYGLLNTNSGEFRYVAAGHPGPILVRNETAPVALEAPTGIPVGLLSTTYEERSLFLNSGDRLYLYSDGLTEAVNPSGEEYGTCRALSQLDKLRAFPLEESLQALWQSIVEWQCDDQSRDDISLVALEWRKEGQP